MHPKRKTALIKLALTFAPVCVMIWAGYHRRGILPIICLAIIVVTGAWGEGPENDRKYDIREPDLSLTEGYYGA